MPVTPPLAPQRPVIRRLHGAELSDPYAWLRDRDWQRVMREPAVLGAEIRAHLEAENAHTEAVLADTSALQASLFAELRGRIKERDDSVPLPHGPYEYFTRYLEGGQHPLYCRRHRDSGAEEVLLDSNAEAEGHPFFQVRAAEHAPDHRHFAYAADRNGSEFCEIAIRDLDNGTLLDERLADSNGSFAWANDGKTLFYTVLDANHRPCRIYRHRLGSDPAKDELVYEEPDPGFFLGLGKTESGRFILLEAHDHTTSETWLIDADTPDSTPRCVAPRERDVKYDVAHDAARERFLILTNLDGAEDFKLMQAPASAPSRANWREVLAHAPGRLRLDLLLFAEHGVLLERVEGLPRLTVIRLADGAEHAIAFDEPAYSLALQPGYEYASRELRFVYSSLSTPPRSYAYDLESRERRLLKQQEVPSGHDPEAYVVERLLAPAEDGALIPISLIHRRNVAVGAAPMLLYGYGAYGISIPASFVPNRFSLIDRGFVYAIAHVRGGTDKGWHWYRQGKLADKVNTFRDFIAAARHLIAEGYADAGNIAIQGGSAGGLLVGAVLNMAPELFKAAVAEVPFVDVLNTMCDASLPLTPPEWPEWGNPLQDRAAFETIHAYSPYENVRAAAYPHILVTAGLTDPRVTYWEPAKWVARLRERKTDDNLLLLRTYMDAGHAGAAGRFDKLKEVALTYAFLLKVFSRA